VFVALPSTHTYESQTHISQKLALLFVCSAHPAASWLLRHCTSRSGAREHIYMNMYTNYICLYIYDCSDACLPIIAMPQSQPNTQCTTQRKKRSDSWSCSRAEVAHTYPGWEDILKSQLGTQFSMNNNNRADFWEFLPAEVAHAYPGWGKDFQAVIISCVVVNQLIGPILCKISLKWSKESGIASGTLQCVAVSCSCSVLQCGAKWHSNGPGRAVLRLVNCSVVCCVAVWFGIL